MSRNSRTLMPASSVSAPRAVEGWTTPSMWWGTPSVLVQDLRRGDGEPLVHLHGVALTTSPSTARASSTASLDLPAPVCPGCTPHRAVGGLLPRPVGPNLKPRVPRRQALLHCRWTSEPSQPPSRSPRRRVRGGEGATASPPALLVSVANLFPRNASRKSEPVLDREEGPRRALRARARARDTSRPPFAVDPLAHRARSFPARAALSRPRDAFRRVAPETRCRGR